VSEIVTSFADAVAPEGEKPYFCFCATLRIFGDIGELEAIGRQLGLQPTRMYRKGERKSPHRPDVWPRDGWLYQPPVDENRPLEDHILALWDRIRPQMAFLKSLKAKHQVDIFCGYRSNSGTAGFQVSHKCLGLFIELEVPFGMSVIIA
jgi:hypothetical protein